MKKVDTMTSEEILKELLNLFNNSHKYKNLELQIFELLIKLGHKFYLEDLQKIIIEKFNDNENPNINTINKLNFLKLVKEHYPEFHEDVHKFWKDKDNKKIRVSDNY